MQERTHSRRANSPYRLNFSTVSTHQRSMQERTRSMRTLSYRLNFSTNLTRAHTHWLRSIAGTSVPEYTGAHTSPHIYGRKWRAFEVRWARQYQKKVKF